MKHASFGLEIKEHIAFLSFNIPDKANALNEKAWEDMEAIFTELSDDSSVRVIVLSGEGKHFCAGIDLATLMDQQADPQGFGAKRNAKIRQFIFKLQNSITSIERCNKPVIAAVHGGCIGGGVDIIAACDMRYCSEDAYFTIKEVDLGLVADLGTLQRLPTVLNPGRMAELAYTGRKVMGEEAKTIGLVNECYKDKEVMMSAVTDLAKEIMSKSPLVIRGIKETLLYKRDHSVADSLKQIANYNAGMLLSEDLMEAFQATMMKRPPEFKD